MARQRRKSGRPVNGILLLDKPLGISSNRALQKVKHIYKAQKAGHTGSLDPLATGVLPICLGEATKVSAFLLDADKRYQVRIKLGETTATADAEGEILQSRDFSAVTEQRLREVMEDFIGEIDQLPPMYSAVKHEGQRLYKLARAGQEVERKPRSITIYSLNLIDFSLPFVEMDVACSKGTYVRTLAEDIGEALGCGAHVSELRRTSVGCFSGESITVEALEKVAEQGFDALDALLLPMDSALPDWPRIDLNADLEYYVRQGQPVQIARAPASGYLRLYGAQKDFIGVGYIQADGRVAPKRLIVS